MEQDPFHLYGLAADTFGATLAGLAAGDWTALTPCTGWTVRDLVRHVVEEDLWAAPLLEGRSLDDAGTLLPADPLEPDPAQAYSAAVAAAREVIDREGTRGRTVHLSFGPTPVAEYAMQLTADHLVHAWDLATAAGAVVTPPQQLVTAVLVWFGPQEEAYRAAGAIGPRVDVPADADPFTRLLASFGRAP